jgi:hypothetical protein
LAFRDFFDRSDRALKPSPLLLSLDGKRVRLIGFMAQMEAPPKGAFYRCPSPVLATPGHHTVSAIFTDTTGSVTTTADLEVIPVGGRGEIRNVILMVGDSMGVAHRTAARLVKHGGSYVTGNHAQNGQEGVFPASMTNPFYYPRVEYLAEYLGPSPGPRE